MTEVFHYMRPPTVPTPSGNKDSDVDAIFRYLGHVDRWLQNLSSAENKTGEWKDLDLINSWVHNGGSDALPSYRVLPGGNVQIRGVVKNGSATTIANLPAELAPKYQAISDVKHNSAGTNKVLLVTTTPQLVIVSGTVTWIAIDMIYPIGFAYE